MRLISGFSFLEVLVSMALMALILMDISATHLVSLHHASASLYYLVAIKQSDMLAESMNDAPINAREDIYGVFSQHLKELLPNGRLQILPNNWAVISWGEEAEDTCLHNKIGRSGCVGFWLEDA